jgi:hypothetical protein
MKTTQIKNFVLIAFALLITSSGEAQHLKDRYEAAKEYSWFTDDVGVYTFPELTSTKKRHLRKEHECLCEVAVYHTLKNMETVAYRYMNNKTLKIGAELIGATTLYTNTFTKDQWCALSFIKNRPDLVMMQDAFTNLLIQVESAGYDYSTIRSIKSQRSFFYDTSTWRSSYY